MSRTQCTCPSTEGLSFDEIVTLFNLGGKGGTTKNCCEIAGYICPNLDRALRKAYTKKYLYRPEKKLKDSLPRVTKKNRTLKKKKLNVS